MNSELRLKELKNNHEAVTALGAAYGITSAEKSVQLFSTSANEILKLIQDRATSSAEGLKSLMKAAGALSWSERQNPHQLILSRYTAETEDIAKAVLGDSLNDLTKQLATAAEITPEESSHFLHATASAVLACLAGDPDEAIRPQAFLPVGHKAANIKAGSIAEVESQPNKGFAVPKKSNGAPVLFGAAIVAVLAVIGFIALSGGSNDDTIETADDDTIETVDDDTIEIADDDTIETADDETTEPSDEDIAPPDTAGEALALVLEDQTLVITEIFYNPPETDDGDAEFLEIHNAGAGEIDVTGFTVDDEDSLGEANSLTLSGTIPAGAYVILTPAGFDAVTRWNVAPFAELPFGLSGGGDIVTIRDTDGNVVDEVNYDDEAEWTSEPDGNGPSLELIDVLSDNSLADSWAASVGDPTPGTVNSVAATATLVINEIYYNPPDSDEDDAEFLELHNPGNSDLDVTGYTVDDEDSEAEGRTVVLTGVIPAGGYVYLTPTGFDSLTRWGIEPFATYDYGLSGGGDFLRLHDPAGNLIDVVTYDDEGEWLTEPDGGGTSLELIDPFSDNNLADSWASGGPTPAAPNSALPAE